MDAEPIIPRIEARTLKVICVALPVSVTLMYFVVFAMMSQAPNAPLDTSLLTTMRLIHVVLTFVAIVIQKFLFDKVLDGKGVFFEKFLRGVTGKAITFSQRYRTATVARLAILEFPAMFGAILLIIASGEGAIVQDATLYLHVLPLLLMIQAAISCYPSPGKIAELTRQFGGVA